MKIKMCHCVQCQYARRSAGAQAHIKRKARSAKGAVRRALKRGEYENLPQFIGAGYLG